jgi:hypothetical protein
MSNSNVTITLTFRLSIKMFALHEFVADEQSFKQSVISISNVYSKYYLKKYFVTQVDFTSWPYLPRQLVLQGSFQPKNQ